MKILFAQDKIIEIFGGKAALNPIIPIALMILIGVVILCFKRRGVMPFVRQFIVVLLLFMINLRIMITGESAMVKEESLGAKVLFVVDETISMVAEDYNGDGRRLDAVKADCSYIIDQLEGAKFSVIAFNNVSQVLAPYNSDATYTKSVIDSITPLMELYARGTSLNVCKDDMLEMLEYAKEDNSEDTIVFYISDGEITTSAVLESYTEVSKYVDGGAVLGYGTEEGGNMRVLNYEDEWEIIQDETDWSNVKPAVSRINEDHLKDIAEDMDVEYIHMTNQHNIDKILDKIKKNSMVKTVEKKETTYKETYYWFALPLAAMFILEFVLLKRKK